MTKKLTIEFCKEQALKRDYELLANVYTNNLIPMPFIHKKDKCNHLFFSSWGNFYSGKGCPKCAGTMKHTIEFCKKYSNDRGYSLLSDEYLNTNEHLIFEHKKCGNIFRTSWISFYNNGTGCPLCAGNMKIEISFCKEYSEKRGYKLITKKYINNSTKMKFIHLKCGFEFNVAWANFYNNGSGCPLCSSKQVESKTATILKEYFLNNYNAISEFKECINPKTGRYLPYDICFDTEYNRIYIEVQGKQHYTFNSYYYRTLEDFAYLKWKDKLKKKHAEKNGLYIEVDLRKNMTVEEWIQHIENQIN